MKPTLRRQIVALSEGREWVDALVVQVRLHEAVLAREGDVRAEVPSLRKITVELVAMETMGLLKRLDDPVLYAGDNPDPSSSLRFAPVHTR